MRLLHGVPDSTAIKQKGKEFKGFNLCAIFCEGLTFSQLLIIFYHNRFQFSIFISN